MSTSTSHRTFVRKNDNYRANAFATQVVTPLNNIAAIAIPMNSNNKEPGPHVDAVIYMKNLPPSNGAAIVV